MAPRFSSRIGALLCGALTAALAMADTAPRVLPGLQADGTTLLHNQWPIRPAGAQVELGDFPVHLAIDPSGRFAAVLNAGHGPHCVEIVDLRAKSVTATAPVHEAFFGLAFSPDGRRLYCSGASDADLHVFAFSAGRLSPLPDIPVAPRDKTGVVAGVALSHDGAAAVVTRLFDNQVMEVDTAAGTVRWTTALSHGPDGPEATRGADFAVAPNDGAGAGAIIGGEQPLDVVFDARRGRIYASLWGQSAIAVLSSDSGRILARWPCGLHPNEILLSKDGRLFISNGGLNTVTVLDAADGHAEEILSSAMAPGDPPGSTPDSLALSRDGRTLYVANAYNNNVAVFDVSTPGDGRALGFIPTGWFPTAIRLTPDGRKLLVISARGLRPKANAARPPGKWTYIGDLYRGSLGIIDLPRGDDFTRALAIWTRTAQGCRPASAAETPAESGNPIPGHPGGASPIRYVIYIIRENRTYDQVMGDIPQGNGDSALCLFPEKVTPNGHAIARQFVLLDNFFVNAEVSASGHEWSMGAYASEFVEKTWPVNYGHDGSNVPYPSQGAYVAAIPELGYLWDRAADAGVTYRSYGEFAAPDQDHPEPVRSNLPALRGHIDPHYRAWDLEYPDAKRAARFIAELRRFEAAGEMPRLQILHLPQDHTSGARLGAWTPRAMVAENDFALGRIFEAVSHSRFWPQTALFVVEDDAQNGPDHVDAHRTEALVASAYTRRGAVDSTPYTTCSMLHTIELILGLQPMSQFDAAARPMRASFQAKADLTPYDARPARMDIGERNVADTKAAKVSATFDFSRQDAVDDQAFNEVIWATMRGERSVMPAPVHAAFVHPLPHGDDDDDDD